MERKIPGQEYYIQERCDQLPKLSSSLISELDIENLLFLDEHEVEIARYSLGQRFIEISLQKAEGMQEKMSERRSIFRPFSPSKKEFHEINKAADSRLYQNLQELLENAEDDQRANLIDTAIRNLLSKTVINGKKPNEIAKFKIDQRIVDGWAEKWRDKLETLSDEKEAKLVVEFISYFPKHDYLIIERTCNPDCELDSRARVVLTKDGLRFVKWDKPDSDCPFEKRLERIQSKKRAYYLSKASKVLLEKVRHQS
ncbi:MAG: hypothetical protein A2152_03345 [Candidatus Levybacteria bacterium RBG_16_35_6]|nr:MAG: hypothetical protein A2152_03345 [Candidatus Levybacteria bacterium RBG_16_35_6]